MKKLYLRLKIDDFFDFEASGSAEVVSEHFEKAFAAFALDLASARQDKPVKADVKPDVKKEARKALSDKATEEEPSERVRIDHGKIMALHNAGWSHEKIADEMRLTKRQVVNSIYKTKKKQEEETI